MFQHLYENIIEKKEKISLVGLGYVGMPIAVAFAKKVEVIGFDLNEKKITMQFRRRRLTLRQMRQGSRTQGSILSRFLPLSMMTIRRI